MTDSAGRIISYDQYDDVGQRKQVTLLKGLTDEKVISYDYDANGRLWHINSAAGTFVFSYAMTNSRAERP